MGFLCEFRSKILTTLRVAVVWRGDREARRAATPQNKRFHHVFEELAAIGIHAEPAVYDEEFANEVRDQLLTVDGVPVWVDPLHEGKTRALLDPLLRDVLKQNRGNAGQGVWKVELIDPPGEAAAVRVLHAQRGSVPEELALAEFMARLHEKGGLYQSNP